MGLLLERALAWVEAVYSHVSSGFNSYDDFVEKFRSVFDHPYYLGNVSNCLLSLWQGSRSVADFWLLMRSGTKRLCAQEALCPEFFKGLSEHFKYELASWDEPANLHSLVSVAI